VPKAGKAADRDNGRIEPDVDEKKENILQSIVHNLTALTEALRRLE
jgi:hypothetical protein